MTTRPSLAELPGLYMQFTHADGETVTLSMPEPDMKLEEMLSKMRAFAVACGYLESTVNEVFGDI